MDFLARTVITRRGGGRRGTAPGPVASERPARAEAPDLDGVVAGATRAHRTFSSWTERDVDDLIGAVARAVAARSEQLAVATVAETGVGRVEDKIIKNRFASAEVSASLLGEPGVGVWGRDDETGILRIADPMGVVAGLVPVTNPVATTVFKALICLKSRNALVVSPHRAARRVTIATVDLVREVLGRHGAPPDLVQVLRERSDRATTAVLMAHSGVDLVLATGGPALVRAAYSSGTPAIGVGAGNAPVWVARDADVGHAAELVVTGKAFDHGVICGSENHLVVDAAVRRPFLGALAEQGALVLTGAQCRRLRRAAFDDDGRLRPALVGRSPQSLAREAGIEAPAGIRVLVAPVPESAAGGPYGREKLAPLLSMFTVAGDDAALELCRRLLDNGGRGHTAVVHSGDPRRHAAFARAMPTSRTLVNSSGALGCIGHGNGLSPSLTLGCGTYGGTSTTDNITYRHLLNIKRLVLPTASPGRAPVAVASH
jgi:acyl-CoA reductase-like NAD-dependent aldehyde dehydrogenase